MAAGNARRILSARKIRVAKKKAAREATARKLAKERGEAWPPPDKSSREPKALPPIRHKPGSTELVPTESIKDIPLPPIRHKPGSTELVPTESIKDIPLPPMSLRRCGTLYRNNQYYKESAIAEAKRLEEYWEIGPKTRILDLGCGSGRLLYGLVHEHNYIGLYDGVDVDKAAIDWIVERFVDIEWADATYLDIYNARYNPDGIIKMDNSFQLPFEDTYQFDIIYLYSVFTHLLPQDVKMYLREFKRLLKEGGTVFLTIFCEDDVDKVEENPPNYPAKHYGNRAMGPLHRVRYPYAYFDKLVKAAGLRIREFGHATEWNGQSAMLLEHE